MQNINVVVITGNLTRDPELKNTSGGTAVCGLRVACNGRRKDQSTGQWEDQPNYFDVTVFGTQGENCAKYLAKGRPVAIDGRLDWREWTTPEGQKRQAVQIIAASVQFLSDGQDHGSGSSSSSAPPVSSGDFGGEDPAVAQAAANADEDIPF